MKHHNHYKENYFNWQGPIGSFGGWANLDKFKNFINKDAVVVDYGCGGGYLLNNLNCKEKVGIEINEVAKKNTESMGIHCVNSSNLIKDDFADVIISNHALEHTVNPLQELKDLHRILKPGGKIIFVVPCESVNYKYRSNDINYHLFSWGPMCLGNLFTEAGFKVIQSKPYKYKWPPKYDKIAKIFGRKIFNITCMIYARLETSWWQVRIVAEKV